MDIFVLPSLSESFSNSLLEAMACGCCVVGSRVGGTPELIGKIRVVFCLNLETLKTWLTQLTNLIGDEPLRAEFGRRAAQHAREFVY